MRRSGFTLIELLVVIAIIAILAAILFPVFARARAKANQASCLSNNKQIMVAFLSYVQDYDTLFPSTVVGGISWPLLLNPYVKNYSIFYCPARYNIGACSGATCTQSIMANQMAALGERNSYALNGYTSPGGDTYNWAMFWRAQETITRPAEYIILGDGACIMFISHGNWVSPNTYHERVARGSYLRHGNGNNYAFADGHAKFLAQPNWDDFRPF